MILQVCNEWEENTTEFLAFYTIEIIGEYLPEQSFIECWILNGITLKNPSADRKIYGFNSI